MSNRPYHGGNCALRKIGNPEGWTIYAWESLDDGSVLYRMAFEFLRGEDGFRKWNTEQGKAVAVSRAEVDAEYARYEAETGKCGECGGHGERWVGWNRDTGHKYAPCGKCGGSGIVAPNPPQKKIKKVVDIIRAYVTVRQDKRWDEPNSKGKNHESTEKR